MYKFKKELKKGALDGRTMTSIAERIGITKAYVIMIMNGKTTCSKLVAYSLTKALNLNSEINDFFIKED